jgi:hypothetical protein
MRLDMALHLVTEELVKQEGSIFPVTERYVRIQGELRPIVEKYIVEPNIARGWIPRPSFRATTSTRTDFRALALSGDGLSTTIIYPQDLRGQGNVYIWQDSEWSKRIIMPYSGQEPGFDISQCAFSTNGQIVGGLERQWFEDVYNPNRRLYTVKWEGSWSRFGGAGSGNYINMAISGDGSHVFFYGTSQGRPSLEWNGTDWVQWVANPTGLVRTITGMKKDGTIVGGSTRVGQVTPYPIILQKQGDIWVSIDFTTPLFTPNGSVADGSTSLSSDGTTYAYLDVNGLLVVLDGLNLARPTPPDLEISTTPVYIGLSGNGGTLAVCYSTQQKIQVFDWSGTIWNRRPDIVLPKTTTTQYNGVRVSDSGNTIGTSVASGSIYIYDWRG